MRRLVVLRPEPGASETVKRARELGLDVLSIPLFEIVPIPWTAPQADRFDGLLLTSANALRCGSEQLHSLRQLPVYAVGEATADAAREAGFEIAQIGSGGIDALLQSIDPLLILLHLCGEDRREPSGASQRITAVATYRAAPLDPPNLSGAVGGVAMVHSPRAARRFAEIMRERRSTIIAAISPAAAETSGLGWAAVEISKAPTDEALLALAAGLCNIPALE